MEVLYSKHYVSIQVYPSDVLSIDFFADHNWTSLLNERWTEACLERVKIDREFTSSFQPQTPKLLYSGVPFFPICAYSASDTRRMMELDIYFPALELAFEYQGMISVSSSS